MRYRTNDLPPSCPSAFMPIPAQGFVASSYGLVYVAGAPGTEVHPVEKPLGYLPPGTRRGGVNAAQGSEVSPDAWLDSVYVAYADNMGPAEDAGLGMNRRRFNELPMPAVDPQRLATPTMRAPARLGSRWQVGWPRSFQRFPNRPGTNQGA